MIISLDKLPRIIEFQFNSTNAKSLPTWLRFNPKQPKKPGQGVPSGKCVGGPTLDISNDEMLEQMESFGYQLVDAFSRKKMEYFVVYFVFSMNRFAKPAEEFNKVQEKVLVEFKKLTEESVWITVAYDNPFFENDAEVAGERALVINCMARKPLYENGKRIMIWPVGFSKENPGNGKVLFQPKGTLEIKIGDGVQKQVVTA